MLKHSYHRKHSKPYTLLLWSHTFDIAALFGVALVQQILISYKSLNTELLEFLTNSSFGTPSRLLIDMLGFKAIEQLIADESKIMVFKSFHDLAPPYLCDLFTRNSNSSSYALRNTVSDLKLPKKSCNEQRCFSYHAAKMWNDLPEKLSRHHPESRKSHGSTVVSRRKVS